VAGEEVLCAPVHCVASLRAADQSTVKTRNGSLAGARGLDESITVSRGIPDAAPPVGALRWAAPMPPALV
jgi:para-nitrobenzyl esterase